MNPQRIQRKRTKGWRLPENTVCVNRPSEFGNPFTVNPKLAAAREARKNSSQWTHDECHACKDNAEAVRMFRYSVERDAAYCQRAQNLLRGKNLACFCALDKPCHVDVLLEIANPK